MCLRNIEEDEESIIVDVDNLMTKQKFSGRFLMKSIVSNKTNKLLHNIINSRVQLE